MHKNHNCLTVMVRKKFSRFDIPYRLMAEVCISGHVFSIYFMLRILAGDFLVLHVHLIKLLILKYILIQLHIDLFITWFVIYNTILDITQFKDGSQK